MRAILALAVCLLALALALRHEDELSFQLRSSSPGADRALEIIVGAKGPLLPSARFGTGPERIGEALRIGSRTLVTPQPFAGLRSALLAPDGFLLSQRAYAVGRSDDDLFALETELAEAELGALLVLASSGRVEPEGDGAAQRAAALARVLETLGARARPGQATPESWALIALRLPGLGRGTRWRVLAEGYSRDSGVALAFVLAEELERYVDFRGDYVEARAPAQSEVFLEEELACADAEATTVLARDRRVAGVPLAAILQPPQLHPEGVARPSALVWHDVPIGAGSGFLSWIGLADGESEASDGVRFELRIDGERLHALEARPGAPWRVFQVDLRPYSGRTVDLELVVDPLGGGAGDSALWGRPLLVHGYDRSPLEAWARER